MRHGLKGGYDLSFFIDLLGLNKQEQQDPQEFSKLFFAKLEESKMPLCSQVWVRIRDRVRVRVRIIDL
jgi:hypothetical protein